MKIDWALSCRAFSGSGSELDLEGVGVDTFWAAELPAEVDFSVILGLRGTREEFGVAHQVDSYLLGPGMTLLGDLGFELGPVDFPSGYLEGWQFRHMHPIVVSFDTETFGEFVLDIYLGSERASVFFRVQEP